MSTSRKSGKRATSYDVAKLAGVSQTTVSLVLSGRSEALGISTQTQEKVHTAAKTLAYYPNSLIRSVQSNRTGIIGFYAEHHAWGPRNSYWLDVLSSLNEAVVEKDLNLLIFSDRSNRSGEDLLRRMLGGILDGIVIQPGGDSVVIDSLIQSPIPMVCIGAAHADIPGVTIDYLGGMRQIVDHLYERGYRNLALLNGAAEDRTGVIMRKEGFLIHTRELGICTSLEHIVTTKNGMNAALDQIIGFSPRIDALICFNDDMAYAAITYLQQHGLRIPHDLAVAGFDGFSFPHTSLKVTTASWSRELMCKTAVDILLDDIDGQKTANIIRMPTELMVGDTT